MKTYQWWQWPSTRRNPETFPWYRIAWNCLWVIPYVMVSALLVLIVLFYHGPSKAKYMVGHLR